MYDVKVLHLLDKVIESLEVIQQRTENIHCTNDFLDSATGTLLLDGVCMKLIATGESIKNLDKLTEYINTDSSLNNNDVKIVNITLENGELVVKTTGEGELTFPPDLAALFKTGDGSNSVNISFIVLSGKTSISHAPEILTSKS